MLNRKAKLNNLLRPSMIEGEMIINATSLWTDLMQAGTPEKLCALLAKGGVKGITKLDYHVDAGVVSMTIPAAIVLMEKKSDGMRNAELIKSYLTELLPEETAELETDPEEPSKDTSSSQDSDEQVSGETTELDLETETEEPSEDTSSSQDPVQ